MKFIDKKEAKEISKLKLDNCKIAWKISEKLGNKILKDLNTKNICESVELDLYTKLLDVIKNINSFEIYSE